MRISIDIPPKFDSLITLSIAENDAIADDNNLFLVSESHSPVKVFISFDEKTENKKLFEITHKAFKAAGAIFANEAENAEIVVSQELAKFAK